MAAVPAPDDEANVSRNGVAECHRRAGLGFHGSIIQAILDGRQPRNLPPDKLLAHSRLPLSWRDQRTALGLPEPHEHPLNHRLIDIG
jgi:hypothetical protein